MDGRGVVRSAAAGCTNDVSSLAVTREHVAMRCGLIPGASGGGLYAEQDGELALVGILSTVSGDLSVNGVVPLSSLQELLQHRDRYVHQLPEIRSARHNSAPMSLS